MKTSSIAVVAFGLLAQAAAAQFQGLGAADPSQQLKTTGMMNTFQTQSQQFNNRNEKKEPLVSGTSDPSDAPAERPPERSTGDVPQPQPQPVAVAPTPWPSPSPSPAPLAAPAQTEPLKPVPVQARNARPAAAWNPASAPAAPAAESAPAAPSQRQSRVQDLVDQIKRRREAR